MKLAGKGREIAVKREFMKFGMISLMAAVFILILTGCGQNKIEGNYNSLASSQFDMGDEKTLLELSISDKEAEMIVNYYTIESSGFLGTSISLEKDQEKVPGEVDSSAKTITFNKGGNKMELAYEVSKDELTLKFDGEKIILYSENSKKYKQNFSEFEALGLE